MKLKGFTYDTPFNEIMEACRSHFEEPKSFKEQLTEKADEFERLTDVSEYIKAIKEKMESVATQRKFYVYLIAAKGTSALAFGGHENAHTIFIPRGIVSWKYVQIFKEALKELGFDANNGISSTSIKSYDDYDCWTITLEW